MDKVAVNLFIMSKCHFGTHVQQELAVVLKEMGDHVEFNQNFISNAYSDGSFYSMHGSEETSGNIIELCASKYYQEEYRYLDFAACMAADFENIPDNWKACADSLDLDVSVLEACAGGDEGRQLLLESIQKTKEAGATGSPTMYIGGEKYMGDRTAEAYKVAICCSFESGKQPAVCASEGGLSCPKHVPFEVVILSDKRCGACEERSQVMAKNFENRFPEIQMKFLDYSDPLGKALYKSLNLEGLPAYLFAKEVEEDEGFFQIKQWLVPAGDGYMLYSKPLIDPEKEICDNGIDDTGNGKVDCKDEDCEGILACRKEMPGRMDLFIMSHCPYAGHLLPAISDLMDHFKAELDVYIHFIVDEHSEEEIKLMPESSQSRCVKDPEGRFFCTLHGPMELEEDLRQACAMKHYKKKKKYMDYMLCRKDDIENPNWEGCAEKAGLDLKKIKKCSTGKEGYSLLSQDAVLAKSLGFTGSPTFLINNNQKPPVQNRSFEGLKEEVCSSNKTLKGCN